MSYTSFSQNDSLSAQYRALLKAEKVMYIEGERRISELDFRIKSFLGDYSYAVVHKIPSTVCAKREGCSFCQSVESSLFLLRKISDQPKTYALIYHPEGEEKDVMISVEIQKREPYVWYSRIQYFYRSPQVGLVPDFQKMNNSEKGSQGLLDYTQIYTQMRFDWVYDVFDSYLKKSYNTDYMVTKM
ncbi:hypothetical protein CL684_02460 [Candidatus Campbellbacteria bacterium]|nr:hypothetical protein [Candidatus Campbellbacteria bacterium]